MVMSEGREDDLDDDQQTSPSQKVTQDGDSYSRNQNDTKARDIVNNMEQSSHQDFHSNMENVVKEYDLKFQRRDFQKSDGHEISNILVNADQTDHYERGDEGDDVEDDRNYPESRGMSDHDDDSQVIQNQYQHRQVDVDETDQKSDHPSETDINEPSQIPDELEGNNTYIVHKNHETYENISLQINERNQLMKQIEEQNKHIGLYYTH